MATKRLKRPRDPLQLAKLVGDIATGQIAEHRPTPGEETRGRAGGLKGGAARASKLTDDQRAEIARAAAQARWKKSRT